MIDITSQLLRRVLIGELTYWGVLLLVVLGGWLWERLRLRYLEKQRKDAEKFRRIRLDNKIRRLERYRWTYYAVMVGVTVLMFTHIIPLYRETRNCDILRVQATYYQRPANADYVTVEVDGRRFSLQLPRYRSYEQFPMGTGSGNITYTRGTHIILEYLPDP
mgnify:FL=1